MTRGKRISRTVVADSHKLFRRGLATLIAGEADLELAGEATTAADALALVSQSMSDATAMKAKIDILVMELDLIQNDPETIKALRQLPQSTAVILLSTIDSPECVDVTIASGARAYMLKSAAPAKLIAGIRQATLFEDRDGRGLSPQASDLQALAQTENTYSKTSPLTSREQEVMILLAEGRTVREVATELSLSIKTIEAHKLNLMRKLDIHNRASLVDYAVRSGLLPAQAIDKQ